MTNITIICEKKQLYGEFLFIKFNASKSIVSLIKSISILNTKYGSLGNIINILPYVYIQSFKDSIQKST
nr:hypothetical protein [Clostridium botulinum]